MTLLSIFNGTYNIETSSSEIMTFFALITPIVIALIIIIGIWNIHKSIDKQTAVQIRQAEALEQLLFEIRNENNRKNKTPYSDTSNS